MTVRADRSGLALILISTAVSGVVGYGIQIAVPAFVSPVDYVTFSVAWSAVFLIGTALSGVQQEVSRSVRPVDGPGTSWTLGSFSMIILLIVVAATGIAALLGSTALFGEAAIGGGIAVVAGSVGYLLVVLLSGVVYGTRRWFVAALITVVDAVVRGAAVATGLVLGVSIDILVFLVVIPFFVTFIVVGMFAKLTARGGYAVDAGTRVLLRNTGKTVGAAIAMGIMITGLPLLLRASTQDGGVTELAATIFAITLTRAPIVIPVIALQSYIIARARDREGVFFSVRVRHVAALSVALLVVGAVAGLAGPWAVSAISGGSLAITPILMAIIADSAVLVAAMAGLGSLLVASSRHDWYLGGWIVAAVLTVALLFSPVAFDARLEVALLLAPAAGLVVHVIGLQRVYARVRAAQLTDARGDDD
ncbi:hypothetical protein E5344_01235 [Microbacterium laevaniformans]|uniref:Polysaccharide biosynthesis protein n=1 Tax=Microbacterium laevaniformans TaxID=36807 RepID=A0A4S2DBQ4_9MICO|nr:hypothetical protein [Microbacterium laevaniformans]EPD86724.1 hypothetical protein HMPREF1529_00253 [Microbacterium sp. oral taxon 186 str. F0373]TGY39257.1 hypothetical protein E5344_01235 [Microbacterium laevaniformans]